MIASKPRALVVGGAGAMGRWFDEFLESKGYAVLVLDPNAAPSRFPMETDLARTADSYDLILLATPIDATDRVLRELVGFQRPLILDIASVKSPIGATLAALAAAGQSVASLHPMWGPDATLLSDKNLLVLDCGNAQAAQRARQLFEDTAVRIVDLPLAEHDRTMAYCLVLAHAVNIVFARVLSGSGLPIEELSRLGGPTFRNQARIAEGVSHENKEMYHLIQALNAHTPELHHALADAMDELSRAVGDRAAFVRLMAACEDYFGKEAPR